MQRCCEPHSALCPAPPPGPPSRTAVQPARGRSKQCTCQKAIEVRHHAFHHDGLQASDLLSRFFGILLGCEHLLNHREACNLAVQLQSCSRCMLPSFWPLRKEGRKVFGPQPATKSQKPSKPPKQAASCPAPMNEAPSLLVPPGQRALPRRSFQYLTSVSPFCLHQGPGTF